jgi:hypothetical protein
VNGAFLGEVLYRLSSNILDDRTRGGERVFREIAAGLVDHIRGLNRLLHGDAFRITNKEVYQKEPVNISLYGGVRKINEEPYKLSGPGTYSPIFDLQIDYGNPFETRTRKPFDFFKLRVDVNFGVGRKYLDNILGYGILYGQNLQKYATASMIYYFYMIHTYVGLSGNNYINILKPRVMVRHYKNLSIGYEYYLYFNNRYPYGYPVINSVQTEQKAFLLFYLQDPQRRGYYN